MLPVEPRFGFCANAEEEDGYIAYPPSVSSSPSSVLWLGSSSSSILGSISAAFSIRLDLASKPMSSPGSSWPPMNFRFSSHSFSKASKPCMFVLRRLRLGKTSLNPSPSPLASASPFVSRRSCSAWGWKMGTPIGYQLRSSMVGLFSRNRALEESTEAVAPDCRWSLTLFREGKRRLWRCLNSSGISRYCHRRVRVGFTYRSFPEAYLKIG
jgi:hypothetical protein